MTTRTWCVPIVVLTFGLTFTNASASPTTSAIEISSPCGQPSSSLSYGHVVWIMLENVGYSVVGSPSAPYLNFLARHCGLATNDVAISHPSLPNYVALTTGSTLGITDDSEPSGHRLAAVSIFSQLRGNWRALVESMPTPCDRVTSGSYAARHNPAVYFPNISSACQRNDVSLTTPLTLAAAFTLIVPNICHDMHSCPVSTGDAWLARYVPLIIASSQYQRHSMVLFITFDENDASPTNRVPLWVIAPSVPRASRVGAAFSHYSLLRTTEILLHLDPLRGAGTAPSLIGPFHL
jgi:hypothetical protein